MFRRIWLLSLAAITVSAQPNSPRLIYATYVGDGPFILGGFGLAVDSKGYAYVSGARSGCAFLTKLNQAGTAAVWSTCLPVSQVNAVALDAAGYIYVAGNNRPFTLGVVNASTIIKLSPEAQQTVYSTSIEGGYAARLVLDRSGNAYITGLADPSFQSTPGAYLTSGQAFAMKLDVSGAVKYATYVDFVDYLGGTDIAVDSKGQAWVAGAACPVGVGSNCDPLVYGTASAIRKFDANGAALLVTKTFGGGTTEGHFTFYRDSALGVAVDGTDSAWIVGTAETDSVPTTPGTIEPHRPFTDGPPNNGIGYAIKLSPSGDLLYGTYVGTNPVRDGDRTIASVEIDSQSRPYFALNVPGYCGTHGAASVMALSSDASTVLVSRDLLSPVQTIVLDGDGGLYTAGNTDNRAFLTTPDAYLPLYPGGLSSGYAAKFDLKQSSASQLSCMVNAASLVPGDNPNFPEGAVSAGEIVTVVGRNLPLDPKVTFDGHPAPILYADANQINLVVPFEVSAPTTVFSVEGTGAYTLPVWPAVPGLFTANGSGQGQLAALNQDQSVNSSANPAKAGTIVSVYMTGVGAMTPPIGDGQLGPLKAPFPAPVLGASATLDRVGVPVVFAGQAPGLIAGAVQVNVAIPASTVSGNARLVIYIGNYQTQLGGTTIAVQ